MIPIPSTFPLPSEQSLLFPYRFNFDEHLRQFQKRDEWINRGMYAFVSWEWVEPLAKWIGNRRVLEVMAGAGWLARALREKNIDLIATDSFKWIEEKNWELQTNVERLTAVESVTKYGPHIDLMIMSWPYMDGHAFYAIRELCKINPNALTIYIGESDGGCTADSRFFSHFEEIEDDFFSKVAAKYRAWWGLHDALILGKHKP